MPIILKDIATGPEQIGVWKINETSDQLMALAKLDSAEKMIVSSYKNEQRKLHWLAYRALLNEMLPLTTCRVKYDQHGKPYLDGEPFHISVSHSGEFAAIIVSDNAVGIDIEKISGRVGRVQERFLSVEELNSIGDLDRTEKLHICWGAKESLYKLNGTPEVDFQVDIHLEQFHYLCNGNGHFQATMQTLAGLEEFEISYLKFEEYMLVWATGSS
ncbi:MAG: 4'-phosphopantetheinyl transferase superfamily protein [Bacteroidota bacterium]